MTAAPPTLTSADAVTDPPDGAAAGPPRLAAPVVTLTDEEIAVLGHREGVAVTPYLDGLDATAGSLAQTTAMRGLLARGIVSAVRDAAPARITGDDAEVDVLVRQDVLSVLTLRRAAPVVVAVARTGAVVRDWWYAHVVGEYVVLEEVTPDGQHRFALGRTEDLAAMATGAVVHPDATDGPADEPGAVVRVPDDPAAGDVAVTTVPPALLRRLGAAYLRADLVVVRRDREAPRSELLGLFTGPDGCWTTRTVAGGGEVRIGPTTVADLSALVVAQAEVAAGDPDTSGRAER